jgi:hypothetical protein
MTPKGVMLSLFLARMKPWSCIAASHENGTMGTNTEDPGELCVVACKAIRDYDIALRDATVRADEGYDTPAQDALDKIPKFLWAVAVRPDQVLAIPLDPMSVGPALSWYQACHRRIVIPKYGPSSEKRYRMLGLRAISVSSWGYFPSPVSSPSQRETTFEWSTMERRAV